MQQGSQAEPGRRPGRDDRLAIVTAELQGEASTDLAHGRSVNQDRNLPTWRGRKRRAWAIYAYKKYSVPLAYGLRDSVARPRGLTNSTVWLKSAR
jgi:hypothetical protein